MQTPEITREPDIIDFIYDHELDVPLERREAVAHGIVSQTKGRYEETLHEIEQLPWNWQFWYRRGVER